MKRRIYFVVYEGEILFSSDDKDKVDGIANDLNWDNLEDTADDMDVVIEDLDEEELAELALTAGAENGAYYTDSVEVSDDDDFEFSFETKEGDEFTLADLIAVYNDTSAIEKSNNEFDELDIFDELDDEGGLVTSGDCDEGDFDEDFDADFDDFFDELD